MNMCLLFVPLSRFLTDPFLRSAATGARTDGLASSVVSTRWAWRRTRATGRSLLEFYLQISPPRMTCTIIFGKRCDFQRCFAPAYALSPICLHDLFFRPSAPHVQRQSSFCELASEPPTAAGFPREQIKTGMVQIFINFPTHNPSLPSSIPRNLCNKKCTKMN